MARGAAPESFAGPARVPDGCLGKTNFSHNIIDICYGILDV